MNPHHEDILTLNRELAGLTRAGIPLAEGLRALAAEDRSGRLGALANELATHLEKGRGLAAALQEAKGYPPYYATLVRVGEASGNILQGLETAVQQGSDRERLERQLTSAMIYPASLLCFTILLVALLMTTLVRPIGRPLNPGDFITGEIGVFEAAAIQVSPALIWALAFGMVAGAVGLFFTQRGRRWLHWYFSGFPGIRQVHIEYRRARIAGLLGTLLGAGIPPVEAVDLACDFMADAIPASQLRRLRRELQQGKGLGESLQIIQLLPVQHRPLLARAEARGHLGTLLTELSLDYEDRYERARGVMLAMLEPFLLVVIGVFCGLVLTAVYTPLFKLGNRMVEM